MIHNENRIMVIAPHIDDEILGCGGVLQRFTPENAMVVFVSERMQDKRFDGKEFVPYTGTVREEEMARVSEFIGYTPIRLGFPLHCLDTIPLETVIERLETLITEFNPGIIFAPTESHDIDHTIVWNAVQSIMRPHFWNGTVLRYYIWGVPSPMDTTVYIPLSKKEWKTKAIAVSMYRTQVAPGDKVDLLYPYSSISTRLYDMTAGRMIGIRYAEAFQPVRIVGNKATATMLWRE